jgi:hypothetical protein
VFTPLKRVNTLRLAHVRSRDSVRRQEIQEIKPRIRRIWARRRGSLAAEEEMLDAAQAAFQKFQGVPPSSIGRWPGDANLAVKNEDRAYATGGSPKAQSDRKEGGPRGYKGRGKQLCTLRDNPPWKVAPQHWPVASCLLLTERSTV